MSPRSRLRWLNVTTVYRDRIANKRCGDYIARDARRRVLNEACDQPHRCHPWKLAESRHDFDEFATHNGCLVSKELRELARKCAEFMRSKKAFCDIKKVFLA